MTSLDKRNSQKTVDIFSSTNNTLGFESFSALEKLGKKLWNVAGQRSKNKQA